MKKFVLLLLLSGTTMASLQAQFTHKIKADSVRIYNDSCNAELILENSTKNIKGFLFNTGNGSTKFKKAVVKLSDSSFQIGGDTLIVKQGFSNLIPGAVLFGQGNAIGQDNANFFWDNTNKRLGLGKNNPQYALDINYNESNLKVGFNLKNTNTTNTALAGYTVESATGQRVLQFMYVPSFYVTEGLRNTAIFSSISNVKLGFVASADGGSTPDIYFTSGLNQLMTIKGEKQTVIIGNIEDTVSDGFKLYVRGSVKANAEGTVGSHIYRGMTSDGKNLLLSLGQSATGSGYLTLLDNNLNQNILFNGGGNSYINTGYPLLIGTLTDNGGDKLQVAGYVKASGYKTPGGTNTQFLKADGSVDNNNYYTSAQVKNLFGATTTSGVLDWNHITNTTPGTGNSLLLGTATNGMGNGIYYHPLNLEYASKDGTGNVTQLAVAYGSPGNDLWMRGRYTGTWSNWVQFLNSSNYTNYTPSLTGSGASGTWGISISGNAATATAFAGYQGNYNQITTAANTGGLLAFDNSAGYFRQLQLGDLKNWIGLGSNAYSSAAYLPIVAGIGNELTGNLRINAGAVSAIELISPGNWTWSARGMSDRLSFRRDATEMGYFNASSGLILNGVIESNDNITINTNGSGMFRARYSAGTNNYSSTLNWYGLQLGNNGNNYIVAGRTNPGGALLFVVNNTSDFNTVNGTTALTLAANAAATFGSSVTASSFSGAGTGLTGTASGLSIGGSAPTWNTWMNDPTVYTGANIYMMAYNTTNFKWQPVDASHVNSFIGLTTSNWVDVTSAQTITGTKIFSEQVVVATGVDNGIISLKRQTTSNNALSRYYNAGTEYFRVGLNAASAANYYSIADGSGNVKYYMDNSYNNTWTGNGNFGGNITAGPVYVKTPSTNYTISLGGSGGDYGSVGYNLDYTTTSNNYTYKVNDYASFIKFYAGQVQFWNAPYGTGGAAMSPTNIATISSVGAITASSFSGAGTGLTGTASGLTAGNSTSWNGYNLSFINGSVSSYIMSWNGSQFGLSGSTEVKNFIGLTTSNWVDLTSAQTINGTKTFSSDIILTQSGYATNRVGYSTTAGYLGTFSNHSLEIRTNGTTKYTIDASGNNTWTGSGSFQAGVTAAAYTAAPDGFGMKTNYQWNWSTGPRAYADMSMRIWDQYSNYGGSGNPTGYGTILHITGRNGHLDAQWYMGESGQLLYRKAFYGESNWSNWQTILTNTNMDAPNKAGTSYYQANTWMQFNGEYGLYWPNLPANYSAQPHIYLNSETTYGIFTFRGMKNDYTGIRWYNGASSVSGMFDGGGNGGDYDSATGWHYYWDRTNACLGIGGSATTAGYKAQVNGATYIAGNVKATGTVTAASFYEESDIRLKKDIQPAVYGLKELDAIESITYSLIADTTNTKHIGIKAQEVQKVLPEIVKTDTNGKLAVSYVELIPVLMNAIKELKSEIGTLKQLVSNK